MPITGVTNGQVITIDCRYLTNAEIDTPFNIMLT